MLPALLLAALLLPVPAAWSLAAAGEPCRELHLRCPQLIMSAPSALHLDRRTRPGRVLLRATSSINNVGRGPLEVRARRSHGRWRVYQAIYGPGRRARLFANSAALVYKLIPGHRYEGGFVGDVSYWKFRHAASFELFSIDSEFRAVQLVRRGPKVDYCLRDLVRTHPSRRSPGARVYPGCDRRAHIRRDRLGTSVGWSDIYPFDYPEQWIDVTGLAGRFAYVMTFDPEHLLIDADHARDVSETYVELPSGRVLGHRVSVSRP